MMISVFFKEKLHRIYSTRYFGKTRKKDTGKKSDKDLTKFARRNTIGEIH